MLVRLITTLSKSSIENFGIDMHTLDADHLQSPHMLATYRRTPADVAPATRNSHPLLLIGSYALDKSAFFCNTCQLLPS